jgi:hypothetical protein
MKIHLPPLTPRQRRIAELKIFAQEHGMSEEELAAAMFVTSNDQFFEAVGRSVAAIGDLRNALKDLDAALSAEPVDFAALGIEAPTYPT